LFISCSWKRRRDRVQEPLSALAEQGAPVEAPDRRIQHVQECAQTHAKQLEGRRPDAVPQTELRARAQAVVASQALESL
jgi:hypothetical protein